MVKRPIIFSDAMVRALLDGRKTQTRRLATSPLRQCRPADRLYVREAWRTHKVSDELKPSLLTGEGRVWYDADRDNCDQHGRLRPGMHMPRWASRLTLVVTDVRVERLRAISHADALAEGVERHDCDWRHYGDPSDVCLSARESYASLWDTLHTAEGERWQDNPEIVALTFAVERCNIDQVPA